MNYKTPKKEKKIKKIEKRCRVDKLYSLFKNDIFILFFNSKKYKIKY